MKAILLSEKRKLYTIVDDDDYEKLNAFKWCAHWHRHTFYATRGKWDGKRVNSVKMHRVILNAALGEIVDHINGCGLDNRKENLRLVTHRQNCQNKHIDKSSKYPGVCWFEQYKKWIVLYRHNGKSHFVGYYANEEEAYEAYKKAIEKLGETVIEHFVVPT